MQKLGLNTDPQFIRVDTCANLKRIQKWSRNRLSRITSIRIFHYVDLKGKVIDYFFDEQYNFNRIEYETGRDNCNNEIIKILSNKNIGKDCKRKKINSVFEKYIGFYIPIDIPKEFQKQFLKDKDNLARNYIKKYGQKGLIYHGHPLFDTISDSLFNFFDFGFMLDTKEKNIEFLKVYQDIHKLIFNPASAKNVDLSKFLTICKITKELERNTGAVFGEGNSNFLTRLKDSIGESEEYCLEEVMNELVLNGQGKMPWATNLSELFKFIYNRLKHIKGPLENSQVCKALKILETDTVAFKQIKLTLFFMKTFPNLSLVLYDVKQKFRGGELESALNRSSFYNSIINQSNNQQQSDGNTDYPWKLTEIADDIEQLKADLERLFHRAVLSYNFENGFSKKEKQLHKRFENKKIEDFLVDDDFKSKLEDALTLVTEHLHCKETRYEKYNKTDEENSILKKENSILTPKKVLPNFIYKFLEIVDDLESQVQNLQKRVKHDWGSFKATKKIMDTLNNFSSHMLDLDPANKHGTVNIGYSHVYI